MLEKQLQQWDWYLLPVSVGPAEGLALAAVTMVAAWLLFTAAGLQRRGRGASGEDGAAGPAARSAASLPGQRLHKGAPRRRESSAADDGVKAPRLEGSFVPSTGLVTSNTAEAWPFENENCVGSFLALHKPTLDQALMSSGDYPYGEHFEGRKRQWEFRVQLRLKKPMARPPMFGIELEDYVPMSAATKRVLAVTVSALRRAVGKDLYHSPGDDPKQGPGPHEKPVFAMPLWAYDQFVVTPQGEEALSLSDPHFNTFGRKRADNRQQFIKEISELKMEVGPTYTFAFWGISQFLDCIKWEVQKVRPLVPINLDTFCGAPPANLVMYQLKEQEGEEARHLQSRKEYLFHLRSWSSLHPPSPEKLREILPPRARSEHSPDGSAVAKAGVAEEGRREARRRSSGAATMQQRLLEYSCFCFASPVLAMLGGKPRRQRTEKLRAAALASQ